MANPYNDILEAMREEGSYYNEPSFFLGEIKSPLPNLIVKMGNVELDKKSLMIDKWLFDRHDLESKFRTELKEHYHDIKKPIVDVLEVGDQVVMVRNIERFVILSKVVNL